MRRDWLTKDWKNGAAALWLAPLVATIPLIPFMSLPSSPFYLGRLMDDPRHPFNWPQLGPLLSALAVFFDAWILGMATLLVLVAPAYAGLREYGKLSARNTLLVCAVAGIAASQFARSIAQGFRQADLRAFANSAASPVLGCICGLAAGIFIAQFATRRISGPVIWLIPVAALSLSAILQVWAGGVYRGH
jgi:hypothetical protein